MEMGRVKVYVSDAKDGKNEIRENENLADGEASRGGEEEYQNEEAGNDVYGARQW